MLQTTMARCTFRALLALTLAVAFTALPGAWPTRAAELTIPETSIDGAQEAQDLKAYETAMSDFQTGGFPALTDHIDGLKQIMARAPASYPVIERRGAVIIVHTDDLAEYIVYSGLAITAARSNGANQTVEMRANVYPQIALLLGSYSNEVKDFESAGRWLDQGLAMQPHNWLLSLEKASSLGARQRHADAVAVLTDALDNAGFLLADEKRARLLRNRGARLIDLGRLDDAEKDLKESIRLLPNNPMAQHELEYIASLRKGGPRESGVLATQEQMEQLNQPQQQPQSQQPQN